MTWGQLRLQLQTAAPGLALDLLDEFLNGRYSQVLESTDWTGKRGNATLLTQAAYESSTDTVTVTAGSTSVTGSGTNWQSGIVGQRFYRTGDTPIYTVAARGSTTSLTLDRAYEGNGAEAPTTVHAAAAYVFMQNIYALPSDLDSIVSIIDPVTEFPLARFSPGEMDDSAGSRARIDNPAAFAVRDDSPESTPPVLHQVELYPPPRYARGFPLEYLRLANRFDGQNTTTSPLPFVSDSVLLSGCRADIATHLAGKADNPSAYLAQAARYEGLFEQELARLIRVEHQQRRSLPKMRMASRFTRHRMERAARGMTSAFRHGDGGPN